MSNHDGGHMLNELLHGLVEIRVLEDLSSIQKKHLCKLLWHLRWDYDCNWYEIIDLELAGFLQTCMDCGKDSVKVDTKTGQCVECTSAAARLVDSN